MPVHIINKYITCAIPADECKLRDIVLLLRKHKHSSYCRRNRGCRFHFPHPPSNESIISEQSDDTSDCIQVLTKVCKVLTDNPNDLTMNELLAKADVTLDQYVSALQVSTKGSVVILKCKSSECNINNYNASVMLAWQANMDIQYVLNAYALKTEKSMGELLKHIAAEARTEELKIQMRKVSSAFLTHR